MLYQNIIGIDITVRGKGSVGVVWELIYYDMSMDTVSEENVGAVMFAELLADGAKNGALSELAHSLYLI